MPTERFEQLLADRKKALVHLSWTISYNQKHGLSPGRVLGMSDAIMEDALLLLDIREILTDEEWRVYLQELFKDTK